MKRALIRFALRVVTRTFYRFHVEGRENIPEDGPVLFVSNHLSYGDPVLISACVRRPIRFLMWRNLHDNPRLTWFFQEMRAIAIAPTDSRRQLVTAINEARQALEQGDQVGLFAEGEISRIAQLLGFRKGLENIAKDLPVKIVPVNLDGLWGSMFSFERGRFFRKWPRRIPYHVGVSFGAPLPSTVHAYEVRQVIMEMGARAFRRRLESATTLHKSFLKRARQRWGARCVDGYTRGQMAVSAFLLSRMWRAHIPDDAPVGVRMEPSPKFALACLALAFAGKTAVPLDPALSDEQLAQQRSACGVKAVISDIPPLGAFARALAAFALRFLPSSLTTLAHHHTDILVPGASPIAFSYSNIQANITGLQEVFALGSEDEMTARISTSDPLTFIQAVWWPLLSGTPVRYEKNAGPRGSIMVSRQGETRFTLDHDNAYVHAQLGGAACVNTADVQYGPETQFGTKPGSLGRPVPGVAARIVDAVTGQLSAPGDAGVLHLQASSLGEPRAGGRAQEWLDTGECVSVDDAGFISRCNLPAVAGVSINAGTREEK